MDPDPDPGGPKTCESGGSGSGSGSETLLRQLIYFEQNIIFLFLLYFFYFSTVYSTNLVEEKKIGHKSAVKQQGVR
jgi:hypothetical protein